jgi:hypothetical protein
VCKEIERRGEACALSRATSEGPRHPHPRPREPRLGRSSPPASAAWASGPVDEQNVQRPVLHRGLARARALQPQLDTPILYVGEGDCWGQAEAGRWCWGPHEVRMRCPWSRAPAARSRPRSCCSCSAMCLARSAQSTRCAEPRTGRERARSGFLTLPGPCHPQKVDVSKEVPDQTADRLISFLKIIKYRPNVQDP